MGNGRRDNSGLIHPRLCIQNDVDHIVDRDRGQQPSDQLAGTYATPTRCQNEGLIQRRLDENPQPVPRYLAWPKVDADLGAFHADGLRSAVQLDGDLLAAGRCVARCAMDVECAPGAGQVEGSDLTE
jgi:hypothetical protein